MLYAVDESYSIYLCNIYIFPEIYSVCMYKCKSGNCNIKLRNVWPLTRLPYMMHCK